MSLSISQLLRISGTIFFSIFLCSLATAQESNSETNTKALVWTMDDKELEWGPCPEFMPESCSIAVLQGDPAKPSADVFFKMQPNTTVPDHWHHSAERMVMVTGEMEVKYKGQEPAVLTPGTYAYGPPEKPHYASCISEDPCVLFIAFNKPVDAFAVE